MHVTPGVFSNFKQIKETRHRDLQSSPTQVKSINKQHIFHQAVGKMSRGGRRGGGFSGRDLPPMGLTFADIQNMSREAAELYPVCFLLLVIGTPR